MINDIIHLNEFYDIKTDPVIQISVIQNVDMGKRKKSKTLVIVPGGGYDFVSNREKDPVAVTFLAKNYNTVTLTYSSKATQKDVCYPVPHLELLLTIDFLIKNQNKYRINPKEIFVIGFSAGGHLVGSYAYKYMKLAGMMNLKKVEQYKPKAIALCYPVITLTQNTHLHTKFNITNDNPKLINELSIELHVTKDYPPTFIWTPLEDTAVDPISTELMDEALNKSKVKHKTIFYPTGNHGLSLANDLVLNKKEARKYQSIATWAIECDKFFSDLLKNK